MENLKNSGQENIPGANITEPLRTGLGRSEWPGGGMGVGHKAEFAHSNEQAHSTVKGIVSESRGKVFLPGFPQPTAIIDYDRLV